MCCARGPGSRCRGVRTARASGSRVSHAPGGGPGDEPQAEQQAADGRDGAARGAGADGPQRCGRLGGRLRRRRPGPGAAGPGRTPRWRGTRAARRRTDAAAPTARPRPLAGHGRGLRVVRGLPAGRVRPRGRCAGGRCARRPRGPGAGAGAGCRRGRVRRGAARSLLPGTGPRAGGPPRGRGPGAGVRPAPAGAVSQPGRSRHSEDGPAPRSRRRCRLGVRCPLGCLRGRTEGPGRSPRRAAEGPGRGAQAAPGPGPGRYPSPGAHGTEPVRDRARAGHRTRQVRDGSAAGHRSSRRRGGSTAGRRTRRKRHRSPARHGKGPVRDRARVARGTRQVRMRSPAGRRTERARGRAPAGRGRGRARGRAPAGPVWRGGGSWSPRAPRAAAGGVSRCSSAPHRRRTGTPPGQPGLPACRRHSKGCGRRRGNASAGPDGSDRNVPSSPPTPW